MNHLRGLVTTIKNVENQNGIFYLKPANGPKVQNVGKWMQNNLQYVFDK